MRTEISSLLDGNWKVKEVELSGSILLEDMALGSKFIYVLTLYNALPNFGGTEGRYLV